MIFNYYIFAKDKFKLISTLQDLLGSIVPSLSSSLQTIDSAASRPSDVNTKKYLLKVIPHTVAVSIL